MLNKYKFTVYVETNSGERKKHSIVRMFYEKSDVDRYLIGFADGLAIAYDGVILRGTAENLNELAKHTKEAKRALNCS